MRAETSRESRLASDLTTFMMVQVAAAGFAAARQRGWRALSGIDNWASTIVHQQSVINNRASTCLGQSVSMAASSIIIASRFLASSNGNLVISAILRSR